MAFNTKRLASHPVFKRLIILCAIGLSGCSPSDAATGGQCTAASQAPARQVVIIGIDGLRADAVSPTLTPFLYQLAESRGLAWKKVDVSNNRTQQTLSAPSWLSILTSTWATAHGVPDNDTPGPVKSPTVFERLHTLKPESRSLLMITWKPLVDLVESRLQASQINLVTSVPKNDAAVEEEVLTTWKSCQPDLAFIHFDIVDQAGHGNAFDPANPAYASAVGETDARIGRLWEKAFAAPTAQGTTPQRLIIFISDHGGTGNSHGRYSEEERWAPLLAVPPSGGSAVNISTLVDIGQASLDFLER